VLGDRVCTFRENIGFESLRGVAKGKVPHFVKARDLPARDDNFGMAQSMRHRTCEGRERREESPEMLLGVQLRPILARLQKSFMKPSLSRRVDASVTRRDASATRQCRTHESHETHEDWPPV
jgi:hypothetical protein